MIDAKILNVKLDSLDTLLREVYKRIPHRIIGLVVRIVQQNPPKNENMVLAFAMVVPGGTCQLTRGLFLLIVGFLLSTEAIYGQDQCAPSVSLTCSFCSCAKRLSFLQFSFSYVFLELDIVIDVGGLNAYSNCCPNRYCIGRTFGCKSLLCLLLVEEETARRSNFGDTSNNSTLFAWHIV